MSKPKFAGLFLLACLTSKSQQNFDMQWKTCLLEVICVMQVCEPKENTSSPFIKYAD